MRKSIIFTMVILLNTVLISIPCLAEVEEPSKWFGRPFKKLWTAVLGLESQVNELKGVNEALLSRIDNLEAQNETLQSDLADAKDDISSLQSELSTALADISANASAIDSNTTAITDLQTDVEEQQQLTSYMSVNTETNEVFFTGANVYVQNGSGATDGTPDGLGNLIIGYNEMRSDGTDDRRTGSHCLVVGSENNFTSYGGIVVGYQNEISETYASVSGGSGNTADGQNSSISGGSDITISGFEDWAAGGIEDTLTQLNIIESGIVTISGIALNLNGSPIRLNGGGRPAAGVGHQVNVDPNVGIGSIVNGAPSVFIP
jgi:hypothetical protein